MQIYTFSMNRGPKSKFFEKNISIRFSINYDRKIFFEKDSLIIKKIISLQPQKRGVSVAQQVEHIPFKDGVLGSSPSWNTKSPHLMTRAFFKYGR